MFAVFVSLLCLMSVGHSTPLACEKLVQPSDRFDLQNVLGRWAFIAGSLNNTGAADVLRRRDSQTIYIRNSSYIQANRVGDECQYLTHNVSAEGHVFTMKKKNFNFTGTFLNTSCSDCLVLTLDMESHNHKSMSVYLLSRRRKLEEKEMEEFSAQVDCLNMPQPVVMDPAKELCPRVSEPVAQHDEKPEGQKN